MKIIILSTIILLLSTGCQNLMHKGVGTGGSTEGLNIVLGTNPESGNMIPIPQKVAIGWGAFYWLDMPVTDDSEAWYYNETKNIFTGEASSRTLVYMRSGNGTIKGHIKIQIEDNKLIDIPIFKVYDPLSKDKEILIDGKKPEIPDAGDKR